MLARRLHEREETALGALAVAARARLTEAERPATDGVLAEAVGHRLDALPTAPDTAAVVLVSGDRYSVIRDRETYEQLLAGERIG